MSYIYTSELFSTVIGPFHFKLSNYSRVADYDFKKVVSVYSGVKYPE